MTTRTAVMAASVILSAMTLTFEMTSPGDDKFWRGLSATKTMIAKKEFERAIVARNDSNNYSTMSSFDGGVVIRLASCAIVSCAFFMR